MASNFRKILTIRAPRRGLHPITLEVTRIVGQSGVQEGLCHLFLQHTSAGLLLQENADPSAREDLESFLDRLVPDGDPGHTHTLEGPDDMPAHIKAALTKTDLGIPVTGGRLALGTWQGIYLWEHRLAPTPRTILVTLLCGG